jgi:hypothetical protein
MKNLATQEPNVLAEDFWKGSAMFGVARIYEQFWSCCF